jgi:hypothetical protein
MKTLFVLAFGSKPTSLSGKQASKLKILVFVGGKLILQLRGCGQKPGLKKNSGGAHVFL